MKKTKLDKEIARQAYILDSLMLLRDINNTGDCNVCAAKSKCIYIPKAGEMVRYNCPFFCRAESEVRNEYNESK